MKKKPNKGTNQRGFEQQGQGWKKMTLPPVRKTTFYRRIGNKD